MNLHVANAGTLWVCSSCAKSAPGRDLGEVTDGVGTMRRIATVDERQPDQVDYLVACPWCSDDRTAVRRPVLVRLVVQTEADARARGLGDVTQARVITDGGQFEAAADHIARSRARGGRYTGGDGG